MFVFIFNKHGFLGVTRQHGHDLIWHANVVTWQAKMAFLGKIEWRCRWSRLYTFKGCIWKSVSQAWVALKADRKVTTTEVDFARQGNEALKCWLRAASGINSWAVRARSESACRELFTWMSSDVKCPFMSLFFFLGGGGAGLWAGGRSVLLRQWKDNMTLSTVRVDHSLAPSPSTPLYYEKSCLHLPFFTLSLE